MYNTIILCVISGLVSCLIGMTVMAAVIAAGRADRTVENMEERNNANK